MLLPKKTAYEWSRELSKTAARRFFLRRFRNSILFFYINFAIGIVCLAGFRAGLIQHEQLAWIYLIPIIVCSVPTMILAFTYLKIAKTFSEFPNKRFSICAEEAGLTFQTSESSTTVKWSNIKRIWKFSDFWVIFRQTPRLVCSPLPVAPLSAEIFKTIEDKVRQHGGQIT